MGLEVGELKRRRGEKGISLKFCIECIFNFCSCIFSAFGCTGNKQYFFIVPRARLEVFIISAILV
jgi:hypothetical protein